MKAMGFLCSVTAFAALAVGGSMAQGALLTYDMQVAVTQPAGVTRIDAHHASVSAVGQVVALELHTIIQNLDGDQTNDGFLTGQGSFVSSGVGTKLPGTLRGGGTSNANNQVNNVNPFKSTGATSGAPSDYEGDGIVDDVGRNSTSSSGGTNDWFLATSGSDPAFGAGTTGNLDQIIGKTTFTVTSLPGNALTRVDFIPRLVTEGTATVQNLHLFDSDAIFDPTDGHTISGAYALRGDDPNIAKNPLFINGPVPEPSSLMLLGLGGLGLVVWRARRRSA